MSVDIELSPPAQEFARRITPRLIERLTARKAEFIALGKNALIRWGINRFWGQGMEFVPPVTGATTQAVLDEFGPMSVSEILALLLANNKARGIRSHPSLYGPTNPEE